jgi:hypothetical protein
LGRVRRPAHDRPDLAERHPEQVVQDERQPFGRGQPLQHDQQRQPDRVRGQRLVLGVGLVVVADDRVGHAHVQRLFSPGRPRAEHVQADPPGDRGQPRRQVDHVVVGAAEAQPGLLDGVVRLGQRAEHPVRHRAQVRALLFEPLGQQLLIGHRRVLPSSSVIPPTDQTGPR